MIAAHDGLPSCAVDFPEAKSWQRDAKTWVFLGRVKVDIMKIRCLHLMRAALLQIWHTITRFLAKNHLQGNFVNFTPRLRASLGGENPSLGFSAKSQNRFPLFKFTNLQNIPVEDVKTECFISN